MPSDRDVLRARIAGLPRTALLELVARAVETAPDAELAPDGSKVIYVQNTNGLPLAFRLSADDLAL